MPDMRRGQGGGWLHVDRRGGGGYSVRGQDFRRYDARLDGLDFHGFDTAHLPRQLHPFDLKEIGFHLVRHYEQRRHENQQAVHRECQQ